jgi:hypothetical protein
MQGQIVFGPYIFSGSKHFLMLIVFECINRCFFQLSSTNELLLSSTEQNPAFVLLSFVLMKAMFYFQNAFYKSVEKG